MADDAQHHVDVADAATRLAGGDVDDSAGRALMHHVASGTLSADDAIAALRQDLLGLSG